MNPIKKLVGPGVLVAAAFIGPGTVALATIAGANTKYSLLWVLLFSILTTILLQEMSARVGLVTGKGIGEAIREYSGSKTKKFLFIAIAFSAIIIGNAAYEAGNISGAVLGMDTMLGNNKIHNILIAMTAFGLLLTGKYSWLQNAMAILVSLMSICFLVTTAILKPNILDVLSGFIPTMPSKNDILIVLGLVGTTVVPYNLFLHASLTKERWTSLDNLEDMRRESLIAILIGGFITMSIIVTAGSSLFGSGTSVESAADMALQLNPLLGDSSTIIIGIGLLAAGISSAITAPLAAGLAANGLFGWNEGLDGKRVRLVWIAILLLGLLFSLSGYKPLSIIKFAQIANGILLPLLAIFLVTIVNNSKIMGAYINSKTQNIFSIIVVLVAIVIGLKGMNSVLNLIQ